MQGRESLNKDLNAIVNIASKHNPSIDINKSNLISCGRKKDKTYNVKNILFKESIRNFC